MCVNNDRVRRFLIHLNKNKMNSQQKSESLQRVEMSEVLRLNLWLVGWDAMFFSLAVASSSRWERSCQIKCTAEEKLQMLISIISIIATFSLKSRRLAGTFAVFIAFHTQFDGSWRGHMSSTNLPPPHNCDEELELEIKMHTFEIERFGRWTISAAFFTCVSFGIENKSSKQFHAPRHRLM